jgi:RNA polymerase-binding transcription factor DksA
MEWTSPTYRRRAGKTADAVQAELDRIRFGTFGLCCSCSDPSTLPHITADPATPFCADYQDEIEKTHSG